MDKEHYHHGDLKKEMIQKGLQLLNEVGYENFSLRKVAVMCGVSHAAPYKHFESKEELIKAIGQEVSENFKEALEKAVEQYPDDPESQIIELGKCYIKFMVENPDCLRFIFISPQNSDMSMAHESDCSTDPYLVFQESAIRYLEWIKADPENQMVDILSMWSVVHGYSMLLVNRSIDMPDNYLEVADKMLRRMYGKK